MTLTLDPIAGQGEEIDIPNSAGVRIGVDVGGTFTKAVALYTNPVRIVRQVVVPTPTRGRARRRPGGGAGARRPVVHAGAVPFSATGGGP